MYIFTSFAKVGYIFGSIGLFVCLQAELLEASTNYDEILWRDQGWYKEELIKFWIAIWVFLDE